MNDSGPKCPKCERIMDFGHVYLRSTFGAFLLFGLSYKHCFFAAADGHSREAKVIDNSARHPAYRCVECGIVVFQYRD